ncbi:hypothetical protein GCM10009558_066320 [Virgisporangium aurantiacum]
MFAGPILRPGPVPDAEAKVTDARDRRPPPPPGAPITTSRASRDAATRAPAGSSPVIRMSTATSGYLSASGATARRASAARAPRTVTAVRTFAECGPSAGPGGGNRDARITASAQRRAAADSNAETSTDSAAGEPS